MSGTAVREIGLDEIAPGGALHGSFIALHGEWTARGLVRWLELLRSQRPLPVLVLGAFDDASSLVGAVIGVWTPAPCDRFDTLFEMTSGPGTAARPSDGAWHLIAVTTLASAQVRDLGLGRLLLGRMLAALRASGHREARTLSPALGLPELAAIWPADADDAVLHAARADGRPVLQVMRLHLGGGARLERILHQSRRDDRASGAINLRFRYATDPDARAAQKERWQRWCSERARSLVRVRDDFAGAPLCRAPAAPDRLVWDGP